MFLQSIKTRLERRERVANLVGDAGGQRAECGEFLLLFEQGLTVDQFGAQRRDRIAVDNPAHRHDQSQQQHDTYHENFPKRVERICGAG